MCEEGEGGRERSESEWKVSQVWWGWGIRAQNKGVWSDKNRQVGHLSEQRHVWSVMLLCNYQSSTTRNELMSAQTALKTDQSVHCS